MGSATAEGLAKEGDPALYPTPKKQRLLCRRERQGFFQSNAKPVSRMELHRSGSAEPTEPSGQPLP
jgi:hypothetical protein